MSDRPCSRRRILCRSAFASVAVAMPMAASTGPAPAQAQQPGGARDGSGGQGANLPNAVNREGEIAEVNGARIFYQITGQGEPMLLLHDYPLSGALFSRVRHGLVGRHRVITLDHRGFGASSVPGVPDSIETYARDALAVMQRLH